MGNYSTLRLINYGAVKLCFKIGNNYVYAMFESPQDKSRQQCRYSLDVLSYMALFITFSF